MVCAMDGDVIKSITQSSLYIKSKGIELSPLEYVLTQLLSQSPSSFGLILAPPGD